MDPATRTFTTLPVFPLEDDDITESAASDLVVASPSVSDSSPDTGDTFTLSASVQNDGDGASAATTLHYYRSTDATITTADTSVGTDAVGALAASATSSASVDLTAPATAARTITGRAWTRWPGSRTRPTTAR